MTKGRHHMWGVDVEPYAAENVYVILLKIIEIP